MFSKTIDKIRLFLLGKEKPYLCFYNILGFIPGDIRLYETAISHKSLNQNSHHHVENNERLEFLGDTVLDSIVADILYRRFPKQKEGFLTRTKSKIVQRESLNKLSDEIGLTDYIRNSINSNPHNTNIGGNAFEAIVGAIYLDKGYNFCYKFIRDQIIDKHFDLNKIAKTEENYKSTILEWGQKKKVIINFTTVQEGVTDNNVNIFKTIVTAEGVEVGTGKGFNKKESQQKAAEMAVKRLRDKTFCDQIKKLAEERANPAEKQEESHQVTDGSQCCAGDAPESHSAE